MNQEVMSGESKPLARSDRAVSATPLTIGPSWLLPTKAIPPPVPRDYFAPRTLSPTLESILERRITILQAPVGFGKTTALAHVAERLKERGTAVAWLSLDEEDAPETFASYIAQALERAGVDVAAVAEDKGWTGLPFFRQLGFLARLVEAHDRDCLFVLDEVDRLPAATLEWVNYLLKRSPGNLHFALACRSSPGLDLISPMLDGSAVLIEKEALRLSGKEIARFYGGSLSRRTLAEVWERTAGWPVALVIDRSRRFAGNGAMNNHGPILSSDMVGASLLRRMSTEDRVVLYEFAVLDGVSANLVEEVLGTSEARRRVSALVSHERLVLPSKNGEDSHRLHPLIREYCANRLAIEYPARKRRLHHGIALALARQGDVSGRGVTHSMPRTMVSLATLSSGLASSACGCAKESVRWPLRAERSVPRRSPGIPVRRCCAALIFSLHRNSSKRQRCTNRLPGRPKVLPRTAPEGIRNSPSMGHLPKWCWRADGERCRRTNPGCGQKPRRPGAIANRSAFSTLPEA